MVIVGWNNLELVNVIENDEGSNEATQTIPVDKRSVVSDQNSKFNQVALFSALCSVFSVCCAVFSVCCVVFIV